MGISSSQLQPQELITFRKLPTDVPLNDVMIPERTENRRPTNVKWLIVLGVVTVVLLPFMIYTLSYSDIRRLTRGYDKCGNICGQENYLWSGIGCSGQNFTYKPYLQYNNDDYHGGVGAKFTSDRQSRDCVQSCRSGYFPLLGRCIRGQRDEYVSDNSNSDVQIRYDAGAVDVSIYLDSVKWQIVICCLLSILVSMGMLFLFRYAVAFVVWGIMIGCFLGFIILVVFLWYLVASADEQVKSGLMVYAIVLTIVAIVLGIILIWCRKKIRLVILLLKEATKAVFDMPLLMTVPVICVLAILVLSILVIFTTLYMATAGSLEQIENYSDYYTYAPNHVMLFTIAYNAVVYLWLSQFFTGIQYMVIAGAVSKWYFSREKTGCERPIRTAVINAFKFHLGTVALGSLIITAVQVIKSIILGLIKNERTRALVHACLKPIENFFKFLSKNSYIITAIHGQGFIRSGKRAAKLILQNVSDIIAVNSIGDFVLGMAKILIVVVTLLLSMGILAIAPGVGSAGNSIYPYIIIGVISLVVACVAFGVFETTIDTLFICYCEDSLLNDGMARPYFMSRNLMEFVQDSKEVYAKK